METLTKSKFDKGIPIPGPWVNPYLTLPFGDEKFKVGDSFFVSPPASPPAILSASFKTKGRKFTVKSEGWGARVWRTA